MFSEYMIATIFYILGIFVSEAMDMPSVFFLALSLTAIAIIRTIRKRHIDVMPLLLALAMLFGGIRYFYETQNELYYAFPEKYVTVTGTIYSEAHPTGDGNEYRYIVSPDAVTYKNKTATGCKNILVYTDRLLEVGTKITASGFLNEIGGIENEHEFDFSLYYKGMGVFCQLYARELQVTGKAFYLSPKFLSTLLSSNTNKTITSHFDNESAPFLQAILTGNKSGFSADYLGLLMRTGIYRVLYTPFIHVSLIFFLAGLFFMDKNRRTFFILLAIAIYAFANSSSPTIIKAVGICGLLLLKKQTSGYANKLDIISKVILIITIVNPLLCFNSGFVISVASSIIVYFSYSPIYTRIFRWLKKHKVKQAGFLSKTFSLWIIFFIGTMPICAYLFDGISVYAIIFMILLAPIVMTILILSPFMLLSLWIFGASPILAPIIHTLVRIIAAMPKMAESLPLYYVRLAVPTLTKIIIFYLFWWIFIRWTSSKLKTRQTAIIMITAVGIILSGLPFYESNTLSVYFVNVGQGDGAILHTSNGDTVLIDGGGSAEYETAYNTGEQVFVPYLSSHGFFDIDVAILSHCHKDHAEGIVAAAESLKIHTIVMPPTPQNNIWHRKLLEIAENKNINIEYMSRGDEISFKSGLTINFVEPAGINSDDLNDTSLVAHISYGEFDALFTGDSLCQSVSAYPENIELLKVAHHGSDNSTSDRFLEKVNPQCAVISVGRNNTYNLPSKAVINRLTESDITILRTDKLGDIQIKAKKNGKFTYKTLKGE